MVHRHQHLGTYIFFVRHFKIRRLLSALQFLLISKCIGKQQSKHVAIASIATNNRACAHQTASCKWTSLICIPAGMQLVRIPVCYTLWHWHLQHSRVIAIRREDQSVWERRAPFGPTHVQKLVKQGVKVIVQPSNRRAYPMRVSQDYQISVY